MMNLGGKNRSMVIEPKFCPCDFFHKLELGECTVEGSSRWEWIGWESRNFLGLKNLPGAHDKEPNTEDKGLGIRGSYPHELLYLVFRGRE